MSRGEGPGSRVQAAGDLVHEKGDLKVRPYGSGDLKVRPYGVCEKGDLKVRPYGVREKGDLKVRPYGVRPHRYDGFRA